MRCLVATIAKIDLHVRPKLSTSCALGMRDAIASWISTGSESRLARDRDMAGCNLTLYVKRTQEQEKERDPNVT